MVTLLEKEQTKIQEDHFSALYNTMMLEEDDENARKIVELYEKYKYEQFNVCFAGHFSAGKSSIINYLLDHDVLPKSPIPTSANIVKVTSGSGYARVFFKQDAPVQYNEPYDIEAIKALCMDRDAIQRIEISTKAPILPASAALIDTPGIDASNDADRLMTESILHVMDVLFYVMDYNHVQSEINLIFLKKVQQMGIPFYIVINQVDKHREEELPFAVYEESVKQTFDQWSILPKAIYYTSVMSATAPNNTLTALKNDIYYMMEQDHDISEQILLGLTGLIKAHQQFIEQKFHSDVQDETIIDELDIHEAEKIKNQLHALSEDRQQFKRQFHSEVELTLKNAYLMPASLRELADSFLHSEQKGFKVGLIGSKKKTADEKKRRLRSFYEQLVHTMETAIQWKLREKIIACLKTYQLTEETLLQKVQQLSISIEQQEVYAYLKSGATVNGQYLLQYTNDLSTAIKGRYRNEVNRLWNQIEDHANERWQEKEHQLREELAPYKEWAANQKEQQELERIIQEKQDGIASLLKTPYVSAANYDHLLAAYNKLQDVKVESLQENEVTVPLPESNDPQIDERLAPRHQSNVETITSSIDEVVTMLTDMEGFQSIVDDIVQKKGRLTNRQLTIALFGTFSAGKSSFSNALFGENILPVSPNPTTAVITRISPVKCNEEHGSVLLTLKNEIEIMNDLQNIFKYTDFDLRAMSLDEVIKRLTAQRLFEHEALSKTYQAYIRALIQGYDAQKNTLGKQIAISLEAFSDYVTDETIACYIKCVDLFYDCPLTRKGITLVDTPGADSVNARHTNVAFDYIKEADAILYVTYYNHAITSGDRDFLMQLGRVKDAFEMDKMFFIVNASDLAESKEDLHLVVDYVRDQLIQFGIRQPNIFPVSSKVSLAEKMAKQPLNQEMEQFENAFYSFIEKDLLSLTAESVLWDMERAKIMLEQFLLSLQLNESERQEKMTVLFKQKQLCTEKILNQDVTIFEKRLQDRIGRQLHFVLDRLYIRFHDMFTEHFNPSTIQAVGKQAIKQLEQNRNQFIDYAGYELLQEVRAVSLRMEAFMKELLQEADGLLQAEISSVNDTFYFSRLTVPVIETLIYEQAFEGLDVRLFDQALKIFKNSKRFFEQNEREEMKNQFYHLLEPIAKQYIHETKRKMEQHYKDQWNQLQRERRKRIQADIVSIVDEQVHMLTKQVDEKSVNDHLRKLTGIIQKNREGMMQ